MSTTYGERVIAQANAVAKLLEAHDQWCLDQAACFGFGPNPNRPAAVTDWQDCEFSHRSLCEARTILRQSARAQDVEWQEQLIVRCACSPVKKPLDQIMEDNRKKLSRHFKEWKKRRLLAATAASAEPRQLT